MMDYYLKKVANLEKQLTLAKIGYREEILKISTQMSRTSEKESNELMQQISKYADAVMALEESLRDAKSSLKSLDKEVKQGADN